MIAESKTQARLWRSSATAMTPATVAELHSAAEVPDAEISLAPDGSFVETPSGSAAHELKRRYDRLVGAGPQVDGPVISPFQITSLVNQHGRQVYRVGRREMKPPAEEAHAHVEAATVGRATHRRRTRASLSTFLSSHASDDDEPDLTTQASTATLRAGPGKKLRKARSNPQLAPASPTPYTQRGHSQSVSGADIPAALRRPAHAPPLPAPAYPRPDLFAETMGFPLPGAPRPSLGEGPVPAPFGPRVRFDSPVAPRAADVDTPRESEEARAPDNHTPRASEHMGAPDPGLLGVTPQLRVMQSFESARTARAPAPGAVPQALPAVRMYTQYPTEVFDVLQHYSGLPLLERLDGTGEGPVIRMDAEPTERTTPRDDPRFVVWGELLPAPPAAPRAASNSVSSSTSSRRRRSARPSAASTISNHSAASLPAENGAPADAPAQEGAGEKVLLAATIERWLAQLTSALDYDELLVFLLTFRTFIAPLDCLQLLIARFFWGMGRALDLNNDSGAEDAPDPDARARRIVRVRTFVALRYWINTFFDVDFLPSRELRALLAGWLNATRAALEEAPEGAPDAKARGEALGIVKELIRTVRFMRDEHARKLAPAAAAAAAARGASASASASASTLASGSSSASPRAKRHPLVELFGKSFEGIPSPGGASSSTPSTTPGTDADAVLDFEFDYLPADLKPARAPALAPFNPLAGHRGVSTVQRALIEHRPAGTPEADVSASAPLALPLHQNLLGRAIVHTIGRLGRWRRVSARPALAMPAGVAGAGAGAMSAFDVELGGADDGMLEVRGGVQRFLSVMEDEAQRSGVGSIGAGQVYLRPPVPPRAEMIPPDSPVPSSGVGARPPTIVLDVPSGSLGLDLEGVGESVDEEAKEEVREPELEKEMLQVEEAEAESPSPSPDPTPRAFSRARRSISSVSSRSSGSSNDDYGAGFTSRFPHASMHRGFSPFDARASVDSRANPWGVDVVSIDDLSLSDSDDEDAGGPAKRRLPNRRDVAGRSARSSASGAGSRGASLGPLQQWQVDALVRALGDEPDDGGVAAALRRLEGQREPAAAPTRAPAVDDWVQTIRERLEAGDYGAPSAARAGTGGRGSAAWSVDLGGDEEERAPTRPASVASVASARRAPAQAEVDPAVPDEILRSRLSASPLPLSPQASIGSAVSLAAGGAPLRAPGAPAHRAWIMDHSTTNLAAHFAMVERELLLAVRFDELLSDDWARGDDARGPVLDWAAFLKARAGADPDAKGPGAGALGALRARFNLTARFVLSEIVASAPAARAGVAGKFIRLAWKCYTLHNHGTLAALVAGLRSAWAARAMRGHWRRVGLYTLRVLRDLSGFVGPEDAFVHLRGAVRALEEQAAPAAAPEAEGAPRALPAGVPFIGMYLAQLAKHAALPDLIDPTAPTQAVLGGDACARPEVFAALAPLPESMALEPLVNVHKQRLRAGAVRALAAGQALAERFAAPVERRLFARVVKLRALDDEALARLCAGYPDG